jgi:hypothetical protein
VQVVKILEVGIHLQDPVWLDSKQREDKEEPAPSRQEGPDLEPRDDIVQRVRHIQRRRGGAQHPAKGRVVKEDEDGMSDGKNELSTSDQMSFLEESQVSYLEKNELVQEDIASVVAQHEEDEDDERAKVEALGPSLDDDLVCRVMADDRLMIMSCPELQIES